MKMHVDSVCFTHKPERGEIGGLKVRFTRPGSIQEITVSDLAAAVQRGQTVQPAVTPFSERNRLKGYNGTCDDDFEQQQVFMTDIDNKVKEKPIETPETAAAKLQEFNLTAAFMYPTFNSTDALPKFRIAVACDEVITDRAERDAIQGAFIRCFAQSDPDCINADRMFFGTDKGLCAGVGDLEAVCSKSDLLAFAAAFPDPEKQEGGGNGSSNKPKFGETIPTGQRHATLVSFASTILTKYGICDKAFELFMQRAAQCEEPKPDDELKKIWKDACRYYERNTSKQPGYVPPAEYAFAEFDDEGQGQKKRGRKSKKPPISYHLGLAAAYMDEHKYIVGVQKLCKGGYGNDVIYEYSGGVWKPRSETDVKSELTKRVMKAGVMPDPKEVNKAFQLVIMSGARKDVETFNSAENYVCFGNAVYRLSDGEKLPHSPEYYFTTQLRANIPETLQPTPYCDMCLVNFGGPDVQKLLLQAVGGAISNVPMYRFKKAFLQYGKGDTGKTQLKALAQMLLGPGNYNNVDLSDLETNRFLSAAFQNVRLGGSNDMSNVRVKELKIFKQLTGGDTIQAENKGEKSFTFRFKGMLWFLANQLPLFGGDKGEHVYNRWILIPCNNPVPADKQIKDLAEKMFEERDSFCIKALRAFQEAVADNYTFAVPESCRAANDEYRRKNSTVRTFIEECCEPLNWDDTKGATTTGQFWKAFKNWCSDGNYYMPGKAKFKRELCSITGLADNELVYHNKSGNYYPFTVSFDSFKELCPWDVPPLS